MAYSNSGLRVRLKELKQAAPAQNPPVWLNYIHDSAKNGGQKFLHTPIYNFHMFCELRDKWDDNTHEMNTQKIRNRHKGKASASDENKLK